MLFEVRPRVPVVVGTARGGARWAYGRRSGGWLGCLPSGTVGGPSCARSGAEVLTHPRGHKAGSSVGVSHWGELKIRQHCAHSPPLSCATPARRVLSHSWSAVRALQASPWRSAARRTSCALGWHSGGVNREVACRRIAVRARRPWQRR